MSTFSNKIQTKILANLDFKPGVATVDSSLPDSATVGELYLISTTDNLTMWNGTAWKIIEIDSN